MAAAKNNRYHEVWTIEKRKELIKDLLDWALNAKDIHLASYAYKRQKKSRSWLNMMVDSYPEIKEAHETAKSLLAAKILNASFYNQANAYVGMNYLPVYDKDYKDFLEWKATISKLTKEDVDQIINVYRSHPNKNKKEDKP